ncbi:MAG: acetolactate synthase small subunit [Nitrososphaerales archaeon]
MGGKEEKNYIISTIVENKPGVLYRASNMFRKRAFNIDSISVGPTERKDLARMTITINGDEPTVEQLVKQLGKLIDVIKISVLNPQNTVMRELALIKLHVADAKARSDIINYVNIFRGRIVDVSIGSMMIEITGTPDKIDAFLTLATTFGIKEIARTGITALVRG